MPSRRPGAAQRPDARAAGARRPRRGGGHRSRPQRAGAGTGRCPGPPAGHARGAWAGTRTGGAAHRGRAWLGGATCALAVLAAAAATVSWDAQYMLVRAARHDQVIAGLEAGIPDAGALIFAALGIALALHGKRALRPRLLNVACVGLSLAMNAIASARGWRDLAIWVMPPAVYALASDTLISVVRALVIARTRHGGMAAADDEATPAAIIGGLILWLVRLVLAPGSTIAGFRRWVLDECPVAPGRKRPHRPRGDGRARRLRPRRQSPELPGPGDPRGAGRAAAPVPVPAPRARRPGKQDRLIALASQRHDLATLPLRQVSGIANAISGEISLSPGTARRVLLAHVRALQNGQHHDGQEGTRPDRAGTGVLFGIELRRRGPGGRGRRSGRHRC